MTTPAVSTPVSTEPDTPTYDSLLAAITDPGGREVLDPATGEVVGRLAEWDAGGRELRARQVGWSDPVPTGPEHGAPATAGLHPATVPRQARLDHDR